MREQLETNEKKKIDDYIADLAKVVEGWIICRKFQL